MQEHDAERKPHRDRLSQIICHAENTCLEYQVPHCTHCNMRFCASTSLFPSWCKNAEQNALADLVEQKRWHENFLKKFSSRCRGRKRKIFAPSVEEQDYALECALKEVKEEMRRPLLARLTKFIQNNEHGNNSSPSGIKDKCLCVEQRLNMQFPEICSSCRHTPCIVFKLAHHITNGIHIRNGLTHSSNRKGFSFRCLSQEGVLETRKYGAREDTTIHHDVMQLFLSDLWGKHRFPTAVSTPVIPTAVIDLIDSYMPDTKLVPSCIIEQVDDYFPLRNFDYVKHTWGTRFYLGFQSTWTLEK